MSARRAVAVLELLIAASLVATLFALTVSGITWSRRAASSGVMPKVELQYQARAALAALVAELEDGIEVVRPPCGATLDYFVVRDGRNHLLLGYPEETRQGRRFCLFRRDTSPGGRDTGQRVLWPRIQDVAFTALAPDLLQVRLTLEDENGARFPVLTAIRCRNSSAEAIP